MRRRDRGIGLKTPEGVTPHRQGASARGLFLGIRYRRVRSGGKQNGCQSGDRDLVPRRWFATFPCGPEELKRFVDANRWQPRSLFSDAELTLVLGPHKGREKLLVQISRLLHSHEIVLDEARTIAWKVA